MFTYESMFKNASPLSWKGALEKVGTLEMLERSKRNNLRYLNHQNITY